MRYGKNRIRYLAKKILDRCKEENIFNVISQDNLVVNNIIDTMESYFSSEDEVYDIVMDSLQKRTKKLIPGSVEWEIAFNKTYEEEMSKRLLK